MLKNIRIYNYLILASLFNIIVLPFAIQQVTKLMPIISIVLLCLLFAFHAERRITFRVIKAIDNLKWINDIGMGPVYYLVKIISFLCIGCFMVSIIEDISQANIFPYIYMFILPAISDSNTVYVGKRFIYTQGMYINSCDITSFEENKIKQGKHIDYTEFIIYLDKKIYRIKLKSNMKQGIDSLRDILMTSEKE